MDYIELAKELMEYQFKLSRAPKSVDCVEQTQGERGTIVYLAEVQDGVSPSEIAKFIGVTTARMANILNNLEKKKHITRSMDPNDRRKIIVNLTDEGREYSITIKNVTAERLSQMLAALGEHDAKEHIRIMKKIYLLSLEHEKKEGQE